MDDISSASKASHELDQLLLDITMGDLNKDFANADNTAKNLIQFTPVEVPSDKIADPLAVASPQSSKQGETTSDIIQDINLSDLDRLNQKFTEQTARNNQPTEPAASQPQQLPVKQEKPEKTLPQPALQKFDEKAFNEEMEKMEEKLARDTAHLAPPPDIFSKSTPSAADKVKAIKEKTVTEGKPAASLAETQEKKLPDWVTMPVKKKDKEEVVTKDVPAIKENIKTTGIQPDTVKVAKPEPVQAPNTPVAAPVAKITTPPALRTEQEATTKKSEPNQGLKPFSEAQVAQAPKPESKENKPKRPIDNPNIANQIQSALRGINELSPALDVFNLKAYVNQGIKEGAAMRGAPGVTDMESLLKQLPFASIPKQPSAEQSQQAAPEQPSTPFNFNLGSSIPNISERRSPTALASNNDRSLIVINQNLNKISISLQQTQQTLVNSLNSLNNTAMEILRTIPTISIQQGQTNSSASTSNNKGHFTPTESLNLIGNFRDKLGLTPRTFANNTVFPGNNSIA